MPDPLPPSVEPLSVAAVQVTHSDREVRAWRLDEQVVVVPHQAVAVAQPVVTGADQLELQQKLAVAPRRPGRWSAVRSHAL